jgi:hypothetical protein
MWCSSTAASGRDSWQIAAHDSESVQAGLGQIGAELGLHPADLGADTAPDHVAAELARRARPWVLLLDDASDPDMLPGALLRPSASGSVLITTLNPHWRKAGLTGLELGRLEARTSGELLAARSGRAASGELGDLATEDLGGLPLALHQVGAFLEQNEALSVTEYRDAFRDRAATLIGEGGSAHQRTIATVWSLSLENAADRHPLAPRALGILAHLAPSRIPTALFRAAAAAPLDDPLTGAQTLAALHRYSLVSFDVDAVTLDVHRLVQLVARTQHPADCREWAMQAGQMVIDARSQRADALENTVEVGRLVNHATVVADHLGDYAGGELVAAELLRFTGIHARAVGRMLVARELLASAHRFAESASAALPGRDRCRAIMTDNYAAILAETGDLNRAIELRGTALQLARGLADPDPTLVVRIASNHAGVLHDRGDRDRALPLAREVWEARRLQPGTTRAWAAHLLAQLERVDDPATAVEYATAAVDEFDTLESDGNSARANVAWALELRAELYLQLGHEHLPAAWSDALRALQIRQMAGEAHVDVGRALISCALCSYADGNRAAALDYAARALVIWDQHVDEAQPDRQRADRLARGLSPDP